MTPLTKTVRRVATTSLIRSAGKMRSVVVSLHPNGLIGLRLQGTRGEELYPITSLYSLAVQARVEEERLAKKRNRK